MLSRMEMGGEPLQDWVFELVGLEFRADRKVVCPGERLSIIGNRGPGIQQLDASWGIRPTGSAKCLAETEAEIVAARSDYREAFEMRRCLVPCSRWVAETHENGSRAWTFEAQNSPGVLLAGLWFPADSPATGVDCVILTTRPTAVYAEFDHRMPLVLPPPTFQRWLDGGSSELEDLLEPSIEGQLRAKEILMS